MKTVKYFLFALLAIAVFLTAAVDTSLRSAAEDKNASASPPSSMSVLYREAKGILLATCMRISADHLERTVSRFHIDRVLEGNYNEGDTVSVIADSVAGQKYILYITDSSSPDQQELSLITETPIPVSESGFISYDGASFSLESLSADIERQKRILTIPSSYYYYSSFETLASACDEIIIGRVVNVSEPVDTLCRSGINGESTLSTLSIITVTVKVENGFYGSLSYGERLSLALSPQNSISIINAADLNPMTAEAPSFITPLQGNTYIFFLKKSEDLKRKDYFTVNPYEGSVLLIGDNMIHPFYNEALSGINSLQAFSKRMNEVFGVSF